MTVSNGKMKFKKDVRSTALYNKDRRHSHIFVDSLDSDDVRYKFKLKKSKIKNNNDYLIKCLKDEIKTFVNVIIIISLVVCIINWV